MGDDADKARHLSFWGDLAKGVNYMAKCYMKACESGSCPLDSGDDERRLEDAEQARHLGLWDILTSQPTLVSKVETDLEAAKARHLSIWGDFVKGVNYMAHCYMKACESGNCPLDAGDDERRLDLSSFWDANEWVVRQLDDADKARHLSFWGDVAKAGEWDDAVFRQLDGVDQAVHI